MKKHNRDVSTAPSWVVRLDDDEDEEDPEFYGAPAFESRLAPEGYKETTRHNPRAIHKNFRNYCNVAAESHVKEHCILHFASRHFQSICQRLPENT
ncbi:hypothetical protein CFP56_025703 [Quercus suber]|uniref:Uncharacterized protein n=1 Tax=Quercus suber TaxID=58331 RepID=A0AAW0K1P2_QUESU